MSATTSPTKPSSSLLFLADQPRQARTIAREYVQTAVRALVVLWVYPLWANSAYFRSPSEKISGFCLTTLPLHPPSSPVL
ncbi:hypothetical protein V8E53_006779 [Lactarius tabidus]